MEDDATRERLQVYEQLGAPLLLYRNNAHYSVLHDDTYNMDTDSFLQHRSSLSRSHARWYYPMDYARIRPFTLRLPEGFLGPGLVTDENYKPQVEHRMNEFICHEKQPDIEEMQTSTPECGTGHDSTSMDWTFVEDQWNVTQLEARGQMLLAHEDIYDDPVRVQQKVKVLRRYQHFDVNFIPRRHMTTADAEPGQMQRNKLSAKCIRLTRLLDLERLDQADPSYLAPFDRNSLAASAQEDFKAHFPSKPIPAAMDIGTSEANGAFQTSNMRRDFQFNNTEGPDSPIQFGNCLLALPCQCSACRSSISPSWCLLHAVGKLQDQICCSFLQFPQDEPGDQTNNYNLATLDLNDSLRQLEQCGTDVIIARTANYCVVFRLASSECDASFCPRSAILHLLYKLDARTYKMACSSYLPLDFSSHPRFGRRLTDASIMIVYRDTKRREQKSLKHIQVGGSFRETNHYISNLLSISKIERSSHHPLVVWSIARSHISPHLMESQISKKYPRTGSGTSLFSIDLRSDQGTFQWSPSAEDFRVEGTHSLSGIMTDWQKGHSVWATSVSCSKTWEIDTRMPCQPVCSWSLPSICDDTHTAMPPVGLFGSWSLLLKPQTSEKEKAYIESLLQPTISVNMDPSSYGIHLFQRPACGTRYQTKCLEAPSVPALAVTNDTSIASSSIYPLPDSSSKVFTCGLAAIALPRSRVLRPGQLSPLGLSDDDIDGALCVASATSKGDVYSHILLASKSGQSASRTYDSLPLGSRSIPVPDESDDYLRSLSLELFTSPGRICVSLTNTYPCPSSAILTTAADDQTEQDRQVQKALSLEPFLQESDDSKETKLSLSKSKITLPRKYMEDTADELESAYHSFDHITSYGAYAATAGTRTDVTEEMLSRVQSRWPEMDDDSSSGGESDYPTR